MGVFALKKEQLEWTPQEMFELLNEGLIEIKDFDMTWVEGETTPIDEEIVEVEDITLGKQGRRFTETDLLIYNADFGLKPVNLQKLSRVDLLKLKAVNLNKLRPVNLNKLRQVNLDKLSVVNLTRLKSVNLHKLKGIDLLKENSLTPVNLVKLKPVALQKELSSANTNKIFVDLRKDTRLNYGLEDVRIDKNKEKVEDVDFVADVEEIGSNIVAENIGKKVENSTVSTDTDANSVLDKKQENKIKVKSREQVNKVQDFNDTTNAVNKGALVMDLSDDEDIVSQEELDREAKILAERARRKQEKEVAYTKQVEEKREKSKKNNKTLLFVMIGIFVAIALAVVLLFVWNNEGLGINKKISAVIEEGKPEKVEYTVTNDEGKKEKLDFLFVNFDDLIKRNSETVAWLKSDDLKLDYPIVQSGDNDFYLSHDIDKKNNAAGWLFMDYENNPNILDFHTVIYGHNRRDKVVFGNLKSLLEQGVASKEGIDRIYFTTLNNSYIFEICSVYITEYTDSLAFTTNFTSSEEKQQFVDKLVSSNLLAEFARDDLSVNDKFLTLSTCHGASGTSKRLLVNCRLKYKVPNKK